MASKSIYAPSATSTDWQREGMSITLASTSEINIHRQKLQNIIYLGTTSYNQQSPMSMELKTRKERGKGKTCSERGSSLGNKRKKAHTEEKGEACKNKLNYYWNEVLRVKRSTALFPFPLFFF